MSNYFVKFIAIPALVTLAIFWGPLIIQTPEQISTNPYLYQNEVRRVGLLLNKNGTPEEYGFLKTPIRLLTETPLSPVQKFRMKKWDIVDVVTEDFMFSAGISDMFILGRIHISFFDFKTKVSKTFEKNILPFMMPKLSATSYRMFNSTADDIHFEQGDFKFIIHNVDNKVTAKYHQRNITIVSESNKLYVNLLWNMTSSQEGIGLIAPLSEDKSHFYYNFKYTNIPVEGKVVVEGVEYNINHENGASGYNYARGVWPYNTHYWQSSRTY